MQLKDLTLDKDSSKNLNLFTEDDVKNIEDIKEKMEAYLEKGEKIDEEIRNAKSSNGPSLENSLENIKETITESITVNATKEALEKIGETKIGGKIVKTLEKPLETAKNILTKTGKLAYNLGKVVFTK